MSRGLLKTLTYSLMHLTVAIAVAYALTGNWTIALSIGLIEPFFQTIAYSVHERLWDRWIPGRSSPVQSIHACANTLERIEMHARTHDASGRRGTAPA